ncbi:MAG: hypothetical protein ACJ8DZ_07585 [Allosphingosinicella sp.]
MKHLLAAALLLAAAPVAAQTIETASGDWGNIPEMRSQVGATVDADAVAAISEMVDRGECTIPGQRRGSLDMTVPFLVQFDASGTVLRLVIHPLGCARAEGLLAGAVLRLVQHGSFQPVGGRREGWFRAEVGFAHSDG